MRVLVVKAHPRPESFCHSLTEATMRGLAAAGHDAELIDLYGIDFRAALSEDEWKRHLDPPETKPEIAEHIRLLTWAEALVFVYPTWWSGPPAILLGWIHRVFVHGVAFTIRPKGPLKGGLKHIRRLVVVTTHGSPRWVNYLEGQVGRFRLLRGIRTLCHPLTKTKWHAMYKMDHSTHDQRAEFCDGIEEWFGTFS